MHDSSIPTPRRKNDDEKKKIINPKTVQSKIKNTMYKCDSLVSTNFTS